MSPLPRRNQIAPARRSRSARRYTAIVLGAALVLGPLTAASSAAPQANEAAESAPLAAISDSLTEVLDTAAAEAEEASPSSLAETIGSIGPEISSDNDQDIKDWTPEAADDDLPDWVDSGSGRIEALVYFSDDELDAASQGVPELAAAELQSDADARWSAIDAELERLEQSGQVEVLNRFWVTSALLVSVEPTSRALAALAALPGAIEVAPNFTVEPLDDTQITAVEPTAEPQDEAAAAEAEPTYGVERIRADEVWETYGARGDGVRVAVLDTGVDATHPEIAAKLVGGDTGDPSYPGGWINFDRTGKPVISKPRDPGSHGTHVAGTIVGGSASGVQIGVAPDAELMAANVLSGGGSGAKILAALEWVISPYDGNGDPAGRAADVINMSLGTEDEEFDHQLARAIRNVRDAGIFPAIATGNEGAGVTSSPGNFYDAVGVGMTNENDEVDSRSSGGVISWGSGISQQYGWPESYIKPDISAPGVDVYSAIPGGLYGLSSGTSMATPHVAGAVALIKSAQAGLSVTEIEEALEQTADRPDDTAGQDTRYGFGRIDVFDAVAALHGESAVSGSVVDAQSGEPVAGATISYGARGETWTSDARGEFTARLAPGTYTFTIERFAYESATASVTVSSGKTSELEVALTPITTGTLSGVVLDHETSQPISGASVQLVGETATTTTDTSGAYRFEGVPIGSYEVRASFAGKQDSQSAAAPVQAALETRVNFRLAALTSVLVLGDNGARTAELLNENGFQAESRETVPTDPNVFAGFDAVLWDAPEAGSTPLSSALLSSIIAATDASGTGIVWLDLGDGENHGIGVRSALLGDPAQRTGADDRTVTQLGYQVLADHPLFAAGVLNPEKMVAGDIVVQNSGSGGPKPTAWFSGLVGESVTELANTVVQRAEDPDDPDTLTTETLGTGIAVDDRASNRHVFLALHGSYAGIDARKWSVAGSQLLLNATSWAAPAEAQAPAPEIIVPTTPTPTPTPTPNTGGNTGGSGQPGPTAQTGTVSDPPAAQAANRAPSGQLQAKPKTRPDAPFTTTAGLTAANAGGISVRVEDGIAHVTIPDSKPGDWYFLHVYPSATAVDWIRVNDDGELRIDISRLAGGSYRFAFTDADGDFVGWVAVKVAGGTLKSAGGADTAEAPTVRDAENGEIAAPPAEFSLSMTEQLILLGSALLILSAAGVLLIGPRKRAEPAR